MKLHARFRHTPYLFYYTNINIAFMKMDEGLYLFYGLNGYKYFDIICLTFFLQQPFLISANHFYFDLKFEIQMFSSLIATININMTVIQAIKIKLLTVLILLIANRSHEIKSLMSGRNGFTDLLGSFHKNNKSTDAIQ